MSERAPHHWEGVTGKLAENDFIPQIACGWDMEKYFQTEDRDEKRRLLAEWVRENIPDESVNWASYSREQRVSALMAWAKSHQPEEWRAADPILRHRDKLTGEWVTENTLASDLKATVEIELGIEQENFRLYTTAGKPLDSMGVDAFWEVATEAGGLVTLTLDYTVDQAKLSGKKESGSECVFTFEHVPDPRAPEPERLQARAAYQADLKLLSEQMATGIKRKIQRAKSSAVA